MKTLFMLCFAFSVFLASGQNLTKSSVLNMKLSDTGTIYQNGVVKGYYYFINQEKTATNEINFLLSIVDENLNEINSTNIIRPKNFNLMEASFNGSAFAFLFYDKSGAALELVVYDASLKNMRNTFRNLTSSAAKTYYKQMATSNFSDQNFLVPIEGSGFIHYSLDNRTGTNFLIEYLTNDLKLVWQDQSELTKKNNVDEIASDVFQTWPYMGSIITQTKGNDLSYDLLVHDLRTGKRVIRKPLNSGPYDITPTGVRYDSTISQFRVVGEYYDRAFDKEMKSQSRGFCYVSYDLEGNQKAFRFYGWQDISKKAPIDPSGKMDGSNTNILFHDFVRTSDGQVFAVGEQYKKVASGAGIGLSVLAAAAGRYSSQGMTQMNIYNLVVIQFNPDFEIEKVHMFEKGKTTIPLQTGAMYNSPKKLTYMIKAIGGFDYRFTQMFDDKNSFAIVYTDFEAQQAQGIIGSVVYTPEKTFVVDKMRFNRKTTSFALLRAKPGYVLVAEYLRKEKKFDMRLEKINY